MKRSLLPLAALLLAATTLPVAAAPADPARTLEATGSGSVDRMPDRASVAFSVITNAPEASGATSDNNARYEALAARMRGLGFPASALRTTGYSVSYNPRPPQPNPQFPERYGYVVTRNVTVTSQRTDQVGAVIDAGVAAGATEVGQVAFTLADERGAYRDALAAAVADASAQARALAAAAHVRLGRIVRIEPSPPYIPPGPRPMVMRAAAAAPPPVPTDVQPSDLTVRATVRVTYAIAG